MSKSLADKINDTKHGGAKIASRGTITWCDPEIILIVTDPNDPKYGEFYDERVTWSLNEERIASLAMNGQINPTRVLVDGDNVVGIAGKRRVLHIREINRRHARGLGYNPETNAWEPVTPKHGPMLAKIEQLPPGISIAEIQQIILAENTSEPETKLSLALKLKRFSKHSSPAQLRAACGGMSQKTFDNLMLYLDLSPDAQRAVDEGRLKVKNIEAIAAIPRADQAAAIAALPVEATTGDEITAALEDLKDGKAPAPPRERKKSWGTKQIATFEECLKECPDKSEVLVARALIALLKGDTRTFKKAGFTYLTAALEVMDKDNEKRRKKMQAAKAKKAQKSASAPIEDAA